MGCNIHLHIEVKMNDIWHHYGCPFIKRDYPLYAKMGNDDRNTFDLKAIVSPKGLPKDITFITKYDHSRDKFHHESWFDELEIEQLELWCNDYFKKIASDSHWYSNPLYNYFEQMTGYLFSNGFHKTKDVQDVRFVFWFDN